MTRNIRSKTLGKVWSVLSRLLKSEDGSILPIFAVSMLPLMGSVGLAVDLGRAADMHSSLQATVDKAAISGAAAAFGTQASQESPGGIGQAYYRAEPLPLWTSLTPATTAITTSGAFPSAVTVKATATAQIKPSFLSIWFSTITVSASATATAGAPSSGPASFPYALPDCLINTYWNPTTGQPIGNGPNNLITLASIYVPGSNNTCPAGQWTSLTSTSNSASFIANILENGCGCSLSVGTNIYIAPGNMGSLYHDAANFVGETVMMPVVSAVDAKTEVPIVAFVPFTIVSSDNHDIYGYIPANYHAPNTGGTSGIYYGAVNVELMN